MQCNITSRGGIYTKEISSPNSFHDEYLIQIDDVDIEFLKFFTEYINIQHQNSIKANSLFKNDVFSLIFDFLSILESKEPQGYSPTRTSLHSTVRQEINILNAIRKNLTSITQNVKHDLRKISAWFIIDYFPHNIDFIALARKSFRPQYNTKS